MKTRQHKILEEFVDSTLSRWYDDTLRLKLYMFYCRVMSKIWGYYHKDILHKAFFKRSLAWFFVSCMHVNPFRRAYNDMKDFRKNLKKGNGINL